MILLKKWAKQKVKSYLLSKSGFGQETHAKCETKNVNKNSLFYSIFVIFFIFWPLELKK